MAHVEASASGSLLEGVSPLTRNRAPLLHRYRTSSASSQARTRTNSSTSKVPSPERAQSERRATSPPLLRQKPSVNLRDKRVKRAERDVSWASAATTRTNSPGGLDEKSHRQRAPSSSAAKEASTGSYSPFTSSSSPALTDSVARPSEVSPSSHQAAAADAPVRRRVSTECTDSSCIHSRKSIAEFMEMQQELRRCYADIEVYNERVEELMRRLANAEEQKEELEAVHEARCSEMEKAFLLQLRQCEEEAEEGRLQHQGREQGPDRRDPTPIPSVSERDDSAAATIEALQAVTHDQEVIIRNHRAEAARQTQALRDEEGRHAHTRRELVNAMAEVEALRAQLKLQRESEAAMRREDSPPPSAAVHNTNNHEQQQQQARHRSPRVPLISPSPWRALRGASADAGDATPIFVAAQRSPSVSEGGQRTMGSGEDVSPYPRRTAPPPPVPAQHSPLPQSPMRMMATDSSNIIDCSLRCDMASQTCTPLGGHRDVGVSAGDHKDDAAQRQHHLAEVLADPSVGDYLEYQAQRPAAASCTTLSGLVQLKHVEAQCKELVRALLDKEDQVAQMAVERNRYRQLYETAQHQQGVQHIYTE